MIRSRMGAGRVQRVAGGGNARKQDMDGQRSVWAAGERAGLRGSYAGVAADVVRESARPRVQAGFFARLLWRSLAAD